MLTIDNLKLQSVIVRGGSGCLFQPMINSEYTYVLTAKHNLLVDTENPEDYLEEGSKFDISYFVKEDNGGWLVKKIKFELRTGITFFPHPDIDIAILKIPFIAGIDSIYAKYDFQNEDGFVICGFPEEKRKMSPDDPRFWFKSHNVNHFTDSNQFFQGCEIVKNQDQENMIGISGGGVFKLYNDYITIIGIETEIARSTTPQGEINFIPITYFNEIIAFEGYRNQLEPLLPPYMKCFSIIKDLAFSWQAGLKEPEIKYTKIFLKAKTKEIIDSDLTPKGIKDYFKDRLLIDTKKIGELDTKLLWITWLEFLVIFNIAKNTAVKFANISDVFNDVRLLYCYTESIWTDDDFLEKLSTLNYNNLKDNGVVLIKTDSFPASDDQFVLKRKSFVYAIDRLKKEFIGEEEGGMDYTSGSSFPFDNFDFVHFEYLKKIIITNRSIEYKDFKKGDEKKLIEKLKSEYNAIFG